MIGELPADVIGTRTNYPPIVDHSWLNVDVASYDNYPSDNNPVRVVPKLHDLWDHSPAQTGINLIPNSTVMPLGVRSSDEDERAVIQAVREAKKAAMAGLKGKELSQHLRSRFSAKHLEKAAEELKKVSEEVGLLGNVYIDASAFNSYQEAEKFLSQHRTRLAQDILMSSDSMSNHVISLLASTFHKNVVDKVDYNESLFKKYKAHLISAGKIASDFVIDSKESLRKAFLMDKIVVRQAEVKEVEAAQMSEEAMAAGLRKMADDRVSSEAELLDSLNLARISPVASFIQENIAKGKTASGVKDMLRSRFVLDDIKIASEAIAAVLSKGGLTEQNIDGMIKEGKITLTLGNELKRIGKKYPMKKATIVPTVKSAPLTGATGYLYTPPTKKSSNDVYVNASVEALKKGVEIGRIRAKLLQRISSSEAGDVIAEAVSLMNSTPAGSRANQLVKPKKIALVPEPVAKQTLPDPKTIIPQSQEILGFFEGAQMEVKIDAPFSREAQDVEGLLNSEGVNEVL